MRFVCSRQFLFAMLYAIQSDIIPIYANMPSNIVLAGFVRVIWVRWRAFVDCVLFL